MTHAKPTPSMRVSHMADALGLDLETAELRGALTPEARADMELRCSGCTDPADCTARLAATGGRGLARAPAYCANGDRLMAMKASG